MRELECNHLINIHMPLLYLISSVFCLVRKEQKKADAAAAKQAQKEAQEKAFAEKKAAAEARAKATAEGELCPH